MKTLSISRLTNKLFITSIFLLVIMSFTAATHSHKFSVDGSQSIEQLDCKLCHQPVDVPNIEIAPNQIELGCFSLEQQPIVSFFPKTSPYHLASPRAPPYLP